ncbi:hypothetical protein ACFU44_02085 [Nocardia rhizosphaerihabitans]|uniref:hypothetical protein n=1 Tax=Nocardia rhizosphaerihabitans TaxID=1691570 RepID=UPI0036714283
MDSRELLTGVDGRIVESIRRVFYVLGDNVRRSEGAIEFTLSDGGVLFLDSGADGEELRIRRERWRDPFDGRMDAENIAYVKRSGKYSAYTMDHEEPYDQMIGHPIQMISVNTLEDGRVSGVEMRIGNIQLSANTIFDQLIVEFGAA